MEKQQTKHDPIKKEPLVRLVKRDALPAKKIVLIYAIAIVASLVLSAIICSLFSSKNPLAFFVLVSLSFAYFPFLEMLHIFPFYFPPNLLLQMEFLNQIKKIQIHLVLSFLLLPN